MAKIHFDIKFRPQIESGEYKVVTGDNRPVRIISWDKRVVGGRIEIVCLVPASQGDTETVQLYYPDGTLISGWSEKFKLFIITPEPELTESEDERVRKELIEAIEVARVFDIDKEVADRWIAYLEKQKEPHYTKRNELFDKCVENCDPEIMKEVSDVIDKELQKEQKPVEWSDADEGMINCNNKQEQPNVDLEKEETVSYLKAYLDGDIEVGNIVSLRQLIQSAIRIIEGMKKSAADRDEHGNDLS